MANVIRLVNGGQIQVRTGVIQGVGPQGPRGIAGPQGADGEQGPTGLQGPIGQILQVQGRTQPVANNPLSANTDTLLNWGSVTYDDHYAFTNTAFTIPSAGDYLFSVWVKFDAVTGATARDLWFAIAGVTIARSTRTAIASTDMYVDLSHPYRALTSGGVVQVYARTGTATGISVGSWAMTRIGSGAQGPVGPVGPEGPVGPQGAVGATGPSGTANAGFAKYSDMLPH